MANSDIIKIGFDYRASLAQFEKETNGVFDGISSKAGKQKITIQLDAKDDKVIDKIKELQKLKLDKFTFEFGNSGLKEQLQTFDKLENKINEIINLSKGIGNSSAPIVDVNKSSKEIDKLESKLSELSKKYEELQKKSATGGISGKEVNLVDNDEFKKLSQEVSELKGQFDDLKTHMSLLDDYTVPTDRFFELQTQVEATSVKVSNLVNEMTRLSNVQKNIGAETNISSASDSPSEASRNNNISDSIKKKKEALASYELQLEETRYEVEKLSKSENKVYGFNRSYDDKKVASLRDSVTKRLFGEYDPSSGKDGSKKWLALGRITNIDTSTLKSYQMWQEELQKVGYTLSEIKQTSMGLEADIIPIDGKAITNAEEFRKILDNISTTPTENVQLLNKQITELESKISSLKSEIASLESPASNQRKDAFPKTSENLEQVAQSEQKVQQEAVATDKALDNISFTPNTEGFDDIIAKFGILREQAEQITKIVKTTKQTADGTPDISYKATLRNGSSYYLGENNTPQVLNASETVYDAKAVAKNAEQEAKAIQAEWDKNIKAIQDYMDAMTKLNNLKAKDKGTGSEANQIELQAQNVEKLKQVAWDARKNLSSMQAENPDIIAWKQWVDMMELFDQASKGSAESAAKLKDVLDNIKVPSLDKYENKLASYQTKKGAYNATIARFNDGGWTSDEYLKNVQAVKDAVKKYEDLLNNIKAKGGIASEDDVQNLKEYESEIKKTISTVTNMSAAEKGYNFVSGQKELDKIHKLLNENSKMSSEAKAKIKAYYKEIESGNPSMSLDRIHGEIMKIYNAEVEAGRAGRSFFDTLKNSGFHQLAAQMAGMFGFYDVINLGKQAFNTVKELDYALVDLKKTTAMNSSELEQFYYDSNDVAKQMGVTTKEIIDQASSWSRLGYNSKQAATEMAKLSSQFSLISPGMDTTTAQEGLVSIMKAWDIGYQDVKSQIMDDINALGNAMAEDNQDIVEGMERSAAALAAVGTSTKDAFALFSGIQEVLQNSEKSGTSLRSVALRLRSFDESTEEYSSDLANITGELADLTKTAEHAQGVSVFKPGSTTEFKNLVDYFREIADIWDEMSQKQQNDFLLKAFGRTQAQAGAALIQNFKGVEKALDVMDNAIGSSDKEMETAKQSITYKLNELKQTWVGTVQDIANRDDLGKIVDGLTDLSSAIGFVIDKLGLVGTIGLFGGAGTGVTKFIKNFDWVFKPYTKNSLQQFFSWSIIDKRIT
mgnify:CR=1 FL=1